MDRNNNFKVNEDFVVDIELLRMAALIENREKYEEEFFSLEPPTDELDYIISQHIEEDGCGYIFEEFQQDLDNPFEFEDYINQMRDLKLIEERELYENDYLSIVDDNLAFNDIFYHQIAAREEEEFSEINRYDYDFEHEQECMPDFNDYEYENEMFYKLLYLKEESLKASKSTCNCAYDDYMPNDDGLCDYLDCYDYPEGPEENLCGVKYY